MAPRPSRFSDGDDGEGFSGEGEYCELCKQEYAGHCPIRSSRCPFEGGDGGSGDEPGDHEEDNE